MNFDYQGAKKAGYSDQEIQSYLASKQPQQQPQDGGGSMLSNLLPLVGGTVGSIGGSFLDPVLGPFGTIGGGAAGAGIGQTISDLLQKKQPTVQDVGGQAVAGGVGGVGGKILEPLLGSIIPRLFGRSMIPQAVTNASPSIAQKLAAKTLTSNFSLPAKLGGQYNLEDSLSQMMSDGVPIPNTLKGYQNLANDITGGSGSIPKATRYGASLTQTPINYGHPLTDANNFIKMQGAIPLKDKADVLQEIRNFFNGREIVAPDHIAPMDALDVSNELKTSGFDLLHKGVNPLNPDPLLEAKAKAYIGVGNDLESQLLGNMDQEGIFPLIKQQVVNELASKYPTLAAKVNNATTWQQVKSISAPYVNIGKATKYTLSRQQAPMNQATAGFQTRLAGAGVGFGVGGIPGAVAGAVTGPALAGIAQASQPLLTKGAAKAIMATQGSADPLTSILSKFGGQGVAQNLLNDNLSAPQQASAAEMAPSAMSSSTSSTGSPMTLQDLQQERQDEFKQILGRAMLGHAKNSNDLIAAYNFMNPENKQSESARVDKQKAAGILNLIQDMKQQVGQAKHIGPFGDILQKAEVKTGYGGGGDPATTYLNQNMPVLQQLIATEVHRRGMSEGALKTLYDAFPHSNDSHASYVQKLNHLQDMMQTYFGDPSQ